MSYESDYDSSPGEHLPQVWRPDSFLAQVLKELADLNRNVSMLSERITGMEERVKQYANQEVRSAVQEMTREIVSVDHKHTRINDEQQSMIALLKRDFEQFAYGGMKGLGIYQWAEKAAILLLGAVISYTMMQLLPH